MTTVLGQWGLVPDRLPATALSIVTAVLLAVATQGEEVPCVLAGVGAFAIADGGLDLVTTERSDLRAGDRLLQLNGRRLTTCADLSTGLQDAQRQGMLVVVALQRGTKVETVLLALPRATVALPAATTPRSVAPEPTALPLRSNPAALVPMMAALHAFDEKIQLPLGPQPYGQRFKELQKTYRDLRARDGAIAAVEPIMDYYEAVATLVNYRERVAVDRVTRDGASAPGEVARVRMPAPVVEYTTDSEVGEWLRRYPFLDAAIERTPGWMGQAEYAGLWKPDEAIRLLVERARRDTAALEQR